MPIPSAEPAKKLAILTCMDARIQPYELFGLTRGDAHLVRNAGGLASDDAIRSIALSQHLLGTREIVVVHHTRCGLSATTDSDFADMMQERTGERPTWTPGAFTSLDELMVETIERLQNSPFLAQTEKITGYVYDVDSDSLTQTYPASADA